MFGQHGASTKQAFIQSRDAAKTEAQSMAPGRSGNTVHQPQRQRLKHEALPERQVQIVQTDKDLEQAGRVYPFIQGVQRAGAFQQRHDGTTAIDDAGKLGQLGSVLEHRQHQQIALRVQTLGQHRVNFGGRTCVQGIDPHHQARAAQYCLDAAHIAQLVGADEGIAPGLAFGLAQALQINKQAHAVQRIAAAGEGGIVGDLQQLQHGAELSSQRISQFGTARESDQQHGQSRQRSGCQAADRVLHQRLTGRPLRQRGQA